MLKCYKKMWKSFSLILISSMLFMAGCKNRPVGYINGDGDEAGNSVGSLSEQLKPEEIWEEDVRSDQTEVNINAVVTVPDTNSMKLISASAKYYTDEDRTELLNLLGINDAMKKDKTSYAKYNDIEYMLTINADRDNHDSSLYFFPSNMTELFPDKKYTNINISERLGSDMVINEGKKSIEDCQTEAKEFAKSINLEEFDIICTHSTVWEGKDENGVPQIWRDGYNITMYRKIDGVFVDANTYNVANENTSFYSFIDENGEKIESVSPYKFEKLIVYVNDRGITGFHYQYPLEIEAIDADNVNLLPYEEVKNLIRERVENLYNPIKKFDNLELMYFRKSVEGEDGRYTIIPVWRLTSGTSENMSECIMINASDGTDVNFGNELSTGGVTLYEYREE